MKITKYEHACLVIEEQGKKLVVDPGAFVRTELKDLTDVAGIVITHVHQDHLDEARVEDVLTNNLNLQIFSTQQVADQLKDKKVNVVSAGSSATIGPFNLEFFGGQHAIVHSSYPVDQNVGVLVNKILYYPGDSFAQPTGNSVSVLALPSDAPWLKVGESMDFLAAVKPKKAFPTHNAFNSELGEGLVGTIAGSFAKEQGTEYIYLAVGQSLEV